MQNIIEVLDAISITLAIAFASVGGMIIWGLVIESFEEDKCE